MQTRIQTGSGGLWSGRFSRAHAYTRVREVANPGSDCANRATEAPTRTTRGSPGPLKWAAETPPLLLCFLH